PPTATLFPYTTLFRSEVVGLEQLVVELEEAERDLGVEAVAVGLDRDHAVDGEVPADVAEELDVLELEQPVGVVEHDGVVGGAGRSEEHTSELQSRENL